MSRPSDGMTMDELRDESDWMYGFIGNMAERIRGHADVHNLANYVRKLESENAKLRELVAALADCRNTTCGDCVRWDYPKGGCSLNGVIRELGIGASIDASMIQTHGYVELPKDADGEPIHVGDVMEWPDGKTFDVVGIGDGVLFYIENADGPADWTGASTKRHHHVPTVEDVLRDYASRILIAGCIDEEDNLVAEYAAKLRLAGDAE